MTKTNSAAWLVAAMVVGLMYFAAPGTASGQLVRESRGTPCTAADKLEIAAFIVGKTEPVLGENVKMELKIKSKCPAGTNSLNVEWNIRKASAGASETVASGTETIPPGESRTFSPLWAATAGTFTFYGNADPNRKISETEGNNNTSSDVSVTTFEEKLFDYQLAKNAGAQFRDNRQTTITDCQYLGQYNSNDHSKPYTGY